MSVIFGITKKNIIKHTPYRFVDATLAHTEKRPFCSEAEWLHHRKLLIDMLEIGVDFGLSHHGAMIKMLYGKHTYSFFDIIPEANEINEILSRYKIDQDSTLCLDVIITIRQGFYIPNTNEKSDHPLLKFSNRAGSDSIEKTYYMVPNNDTDKARRYFELSDNMPFSADPSEEEKSILDAGPGVRINDDEKEVFSRPVWQSTQGKPYNKGELQEDLKRIIADEFSEYSLHQTVEPRGIIEHYRAFSQNIQTPPL